MEPADLIPSKSSPPPLDGVGHEMGSAEEEPRGFGQVSVGVSCRPPGLTDSPDSPSSLRQPSPPIKSTTHQPGCNFSLSVKQSQPTFSMNSGSGWNGRDTEHQALEAESFVHLTNDYRSADTRRASAANARLPREEMGFADFTVFTEQTVHQWCCGFTPSGNPEKLDSGLEQRNTSNSPVERAFKPGQGVFGDSVLSPHSSKAKEKDCTIIRHWQEGDAAVTQPSQDQQQPQETTVTLVLPFVKPYFEKEEPDQNDLTCRGSSYKTSEVQEDGGEQSARGEEPGNSHSVNSSTVKSTQPETEEGLQRFISSETQENSATSSQLQSGSHSEDDVSDAHCSLESQRDPTHVHTANAAVLILGTLPPSDSFADFCAAPVRDDGENLWAEFTGLKEQGGETAWTREHARHVPAEEEDKAEQCGLIEQTSCQVSLSCRVQQLFLASFLEAEGPSPGSEQEVLSLAALLDVQHSPQSEEEEEQRSQWIQKGLWWLHQDLHSAVGLRFQWGGSHSSRTLLRCLGVDAKSICLLETTKDSASAARSPRRTAGPAPAPAPAPPTQEPIPSSQMDWNNRGLSSSQDGTCLRRAPHFWGRK